MATFKQRVESYIGTISDTTNLNEWLKEEARNFISILPVSHLYQFQEWVDADTNLATGRFLHNVRLDDGDGRTHRAIEVPYEKLDSYRYEDSLYYATLRSPVYAIKNNLVITVPDNLIDNTNSKILFISYPSPVYGDSSISGYPLQLEEYIVLGSAIKGLTGILYNSIDSISSELPTAPSAPSFTYTDANGTTVTATTIDISSLTSPSYNTPTNTIDFTTANTIINTEEDIELAEAELAQQNGKINEYSANIANASKEFEEDLTVYKARVEEKFENARLLQQKLLSDAQRTDNIELANKAKQLESQVSEYMAEIQKYQAEISAYQIDVTANAAKADKYLGLLTKLRELKLEVLQTYLGQFNQGK